MEKLDRYYIGPGLRRSDPWRYVASERGGRRWVWLFEYPPKRVQQMTERRSLRWVVASGDALSVDDADLASIPLTRPVLIATLPELAGRYPERWKYVARDTGAGIRLFEVKPGRADHTVTRPGRRITWEPTRGRFARMPFHPAGVAPGEVYELDWTYDDAAAAIPRSERGDITTLRGIDPTACECGAVGW